MKSHHEEDKDHRVQTCDYVGKDTGMGRRDKGEEKVQGQTRFWSGRVRKTYMAARVVQGICLFRTKKRQSGRRSTQGRGEDV